MQNHQEFLSLSLFFGFFFNMTCRTQYKSYSTLLFLSVSLELSLRREERTRAERTPVLKDLDTPGPECLSPSLFLLPSPTFSIFSYQPLGPALDLDLC